mmetsp:Transcript_111181/g.315412  ORF Transcript_111181/g.315412 Transcript_111181/m.315412 type:complete len:243 (+) Transcript_111181:206-934(+)
MWIKRWGARGRTRGAIAVWQRHAHKHCRSLCREVLYTGVCGNEKTSVHEFSRRSGRFQCWRSHMGGLDMEVPVLRRRAPAVHPGRRTGASSGAPCAPPCGTASTGAASAPNAPSGASASRQGHTGGRTGTPPRSRSPSCGRKRRACTGGPGAAVSPPTAPPGQSRRRPPTASPGRTATGPPPPIADSDRSPRRTATAARLPGSFPRSRAPGRSRAPSRSRGVGGSWPCGDAARPRSASRAPC